MLRFKQTVFYLCKPVSDQLAHGGHRVAQKMLAAARTAVVLDDAGRHVDRHEAVGGSSVDGRHNWSDPRGDHALVITAA